MYTKYQAFCEHCWKDVDYYLEDCVTSTKKYGKIYEHPTKEAYCVHCNEKASHLALIDYNVQSLSQKYREDHNLLSFTEIREISSIYNISVSTLAKILDNVELFEECYSGQEPDYEESQELYKLRYDPHYFLETLEAHKDKISLISYVKAKFAAQCRLGSVAQSKLYYACLYFIHKKGSINKFVLQQLLYYTQGFSRIVFGYYLFEQECYAWNEAPIFEAAYNELKNRNIYTDSFRLSLFSDELPDHFSDVFLDYEIELLDTIIRSFGHFAKEELVEFTHSEKPWLDAYATESKLISKDAFYQHFVNLQIEHGIFKYRDIENYVEYLVAKTQGQEISTGLVAAPNA